MSIWNEDERDRKQRSFGFIGLSMMAHLGLLSLLTVLPGQTHPGSSLASSPGSGTGTNNGNGASSPVFMELQDPAPANEMTAKNEPSTLAATVAVEETSIPHSSASTPIDNTVVVPTILPAMEKAKPVSKNKRVIKARRQVVPTEVPEARPEVASADSTTASHNPESEPQTINDPETPSVNTEAAQEVVSKEGENLAPTSPAAEEPVIETVTPIPVAEVTPVEDAPAPASAPAAAKPYYGRVPPQPPTVGQLSNGGNASGTAPEGAEGLGNAVGRSGPVGLGAGTVIRDASELIPKAGNPSPPYPIEDRRRGREGSNSILANILADGSVGQVVLEKSSGSPFMDTAAIEAFKKWKFLPGQAGWVRQPFSFTLTGQAQTVPARLRRR